MAWKRQSKEEKQRLHRRRRRQLIGGVLSVLIVVGLVTVVGTAAKSVSKLFDDTKEKDSYAALLTPLVMLDPVPFDSLANADQTLLLQSALWSTIYSEDLTKYDRDDYGRLILPVVDVDKNAAKIYGADYKLAHATFDAGGMSFVYDETSKSYAIPVTGTTNSYTPQVEKITSTVKEKRVTVGYIAPDTGFSLDSNNADADKPVKYYDFIFTRQGDGYYLTAMTESEMKIEQSQTTGASSDATTDLTQDIMRQAETAAQTQSTAQPVADSTAP